MPRRLGVPLAGSGIENILGAHGFENDFAVDQMTDSIHVNLHFLLFR